MLRNIADKLASSIKEATGCDAAVINQNAIIIAATDQTRIGKFNEASVQVIREGKPLKHDRKYLELQNTKPGHTAPIFYNGEVIGAVGIEGEKEEVRKYASLVQRLAEMMIKENADQVFLLRTLRAHLGLMEAIMSFDETEDERLLIHRGLELGINLKIPRVVIIVSIVNPSKIPLGYIDAVRLIRGVFDNDDDVCSSPAVDKFILMHNAATLSQKNQKKELLKKCEAVLEQLKSYDMDAFCCVGTRAEAIMELKGSMKGAWTLVQIAEKLQKECDKKVYFSEEHFIELMIFNTRRNEIEWYFQQHLVPLLAHADSQELQKTVQAWCESGFSYKAASEALFIHRNTLIYRLQKIGTLCGLDMTNYKEAISLYLALIKYDLSQ